MECSWYDEHILEVRLVCKLISEGGVLFLVMDGTRVELSV